MPPCLLWCAVASIGKCVVARTVPWLEPGSPDDAVKSVPELLNSSGTGFADFTKDNIGAESLKFECRERERESSSN